MAVSDAEERFSSLELAVHNIEIDEAEVAAALAPLLAASINVMTNEQLADLADRIVTVQGQRLAGKA